MPLLQILGDLPSGISCQPEGHLADGRRVDIKCSYDNLMLPIEVKGQWHRSLWRAADEQLYGLYSSDWRADSKGIYLVFWFGQEVPNNKKPTSPENGERCPETADELREELAKNSFAAQQKRIEIFVLDLVRPQSS